MPLINYSHIVDRFSHIDARFVACNITMPQGSSFYRVAIYPWWEHPLLLKARAEGASWGFRDLPDEAYKQVTVYPRELHKADLSPASDVIDWEFTQDHWLLWNYEGSMEITCNSRLSVNDWMDVVENVCETLGNGCSFEIINGYASFADIFRWGQNAPFLLGRFPRPIAAGMCRAVEEKGIRYSAGKEPEPVKLPVLFLINGSDHIIADDFEVEIPEFVHQAEWFRMD